MGTLFEGMHFLTKQEVQHVLQQYHVSKWANYKTQLSNPTKLIVICDEGSCAWRCKTSYILASKQWEIRKLRESHTCSNPSISQDHAKLSYLLISKSIHNLIENDSSTSVSALIVHIKSTEGYTTTYHKAWLTKQKAIENIYDNYERSYHDLPRLLQAMQQFCSWFGCGEGNTANITTRRSSSREFRDVPSSFFWVSDNVSMGFNIAS